MTGAVIYFMSYNTFPDARTSLRCFQVILLKRAMEPRIEFLTRDFFFGFAGLF